MKKPTENYPIFKRQRGSQICDPIFRILMISIDRPYKALIFDLDGTLADTMPLHYKACQLVCNNHGFDFPHDYFLQEAGKPTQVVFKNLIQKLGLNFDGAELGRQKEAQFLAIINEVKPLKLVADVVDQNLGKVPMAIGSGGERKSVDLTLEIIGYHNKFQAIVTCDDVKNTKPHPETFLKGAQILGVSPADCIVFEDGDPGIQAAKSAGMGWIDVRNYL